MAQLNFDARQVAPDEGRGDPVPAGWYNAAITASEIKPTSKGDGVFLAATFQIVDGQFQGRKIFFNFNIRNNNPQTVEIAYKQLSAVCHAIGRLTVGESEEMHNVPMKIRVKVRPATADYEAANDITSFKNINEQVQTGPSGAPTAGPAGYNPGQPPQPPGAAPAHSAPPAWGQPGAAMAPPQQQPQQQFAPPQQQQQQQQQPPQQQAAPAPAPAWAPPAGGQPWAPAAAAPTAAPGQQVPWGAPQ
jgi:hypothetical protein